MLGMHMLKRSNTYLSIDLTSDVGRRKERTKRKESFAVNSSAGSVEEWYDRRSGSA